MSHHPFDQMSDDYRNDVERKISLLEPVANEIHGHLRSLLAGKGDKFIISVYFRVKRKDRIAEKDIIGEFGLRARETNVQDIYMRRDLYFFLIRMLVTQRSSTIY